MKPYLSKKVSSGFDETIQLVTDILKEFGFGLLTEIDVKETLRKKIDANFHPYKILGFCNPKFAYKALSQQDKLGIMLPCNVVVQEHEDGKVEVVLVNPDVTLKTFHDPELDDFACEVTGVMKRLLNRLT